MDIQAFSSLFEVIGALASILSILMFFIRISIGDYFFTYSIDVKIKKYFTFRHFHFSTFLPKAQKEEIIGDLLEMKTQLQDEGYSHWKIWRIMAYQKFSIFLSIQWQKFTSWLSQKTKIDQ